MYIILVMEIKENNELYIYIWNLFEYRKERRSRRVRDDINLLESGSLK